MTRAAIVLCLVFSLCLAALATASNPKNVIVMIGDGMGPNHVQYARWVEYGPQATPQDGLSMERLAYSYNSKVRTYSADNDITDSAAGATAISTGTKTNNKRIAMSPAMKPLTTILEIAKDMGMPTGLVTSTDLTDATPASFAAHAPSRYNTSIIAADMTKSDVDIMLGGGRATFTEEQINRMKSREYTFLETRAQLMDALNYDDIPVGTSCSRLLAEKALGLFAPKHMPWEFFRDSEQTPSLSELTRKALEFLSRKAACKDSGFFLMVEGGQIDKAAHVNNATLNPLETIEFANAIQVAIDFIGSRDDTLLLVTADHETGGLSVNGEAALEQLPLVTASMSHEEKRALRVQRAQALNVTWTTGEHTAVNVPLYSNRPDIINAFVAKNYPQETPESVQLNNIDLFVIMKQFYGAEDVKLSALGLITNLVPSLVMALGCIVTAVIILAVHFKNVRAERQRGNDGLANQL